MVSRDTKVTAVFVVLGVAAWLATDAVADGPWPWIVLFGVGVLVPMLVNDRLDARAAGDDADR
ncbi:hypothetical protein [Halostella salina]|uniref:hypothetical protein n=1 Tax=Halostella salina TaxID=1547897 RepID=UPI000EF84239|nr:hypothetical protein [Halostella salina]